jgi:predicted Rdx family selenoprotein
VAALKAEGFDAVDVPGEKSQFDVLADGRLVFSKQREGRFPDPGEILDALR